MQGPSAFVARLVSCAAASNGWTSSEREKQMKEENERRIERTNRKKKPARSKTSASFREDPSPSISCSDEKPEGASGAAWQMARSHDEGKREDDEKKYHQMTNQAEYEPRQARTCLRLPASQSAGVLGRRGSRSLVISSEEVKEEGKYEEIEKRLEEMTTNDETDRGRGQVPKSKPILTSNNRGTNRLSARKS